jgi:hypothetical protein
MSEEPEAQFVPPPKKEGPARPSILGGTADRRVCARAPPRAPHPPDPMMLGFNPFAGPPTSKAAQMAMASAAAARASASAADVPAPAAAATTTGTAAAAADAPPATEAVPKKFKPPVGAVNLMAGMPLGGGFPAYGRAAVPPPKHHVCG